MAHTYMRFDFGADETKAQEARHKLDTWKQAFRLDKKLQYKLDRPEDESLEEGGEEEESKPTKGSPKSAAEGHDDRPSKSQESDVTLLVRLYFSSHEKLSEQRWLDRIPAEEPFKSASPKVIRKGDPAFEETVQQFGNPERSSISG